MADFQFANQYQLVPNIPNDNKMQQGMQQMLANKRYAEQQQKQGKAQEALGAMISLRNAPPEQQGEMLKAMIESGLAPKEAANLVGSPQNINPFVDMMLGGMGVNTNQGREDRFGKVTAGMQGDEPVYFQTDSAGNTRVVDDIKPITTGQKEDEKTDALLKREELLKSKQLGIQKQQMDLDKRRLDMGLNEAKKEVQNAEAMMGINIAQDLLASDLGSIYGWGEEYYPEILRSQSGIDLSTKRNQLIAMLELGSRGKLKGQGTVTDTEQKVLSRAVTSLSNPNISMDLAKTELGSAIESLKRTMSEDARAALGGSTEQAQKDTASYQKPNKMQIDYLIKNPQFKEKFIEKFGELPEGFQ